MKKHIFRSIVIVALSVLVLSFIVMLTVMYRSLVEEQRQQLGTKLAIVAHGAEEGGIEWLDSLDIKGYRITLIAFDGVVLYDSIADAATMENHLDRQEIVEALQSGTGESRRISSTLTEKTFYQATRLTDGNILRISITSNSVLSILLGMLMPVLLILVATIVISSFLANRIAKRTIGSLNTLDLEHPLNNNTYDELSPLLLRIAHQQRQIESQRSELNKKRDEFSLITQSMNEGLVLLNDKGVVVSINPAAQQVFRTDSSGIGKDFLVVERSSEIRGVMKTAAESGHGQVKLRRLGRRYEINASRIDFNDETVGTAILVFDVTEKSLLEQQRREFTANVSHELKTPLQSIMGRAELIENGLAKPEDISRFVNCIRTEASRLLVLIEDIIHLSQLDEGGELPWENVDLHQIAKETLDVLQDAAGTKNIRLLLTGSPVTVTGVRGLLGEIVYNLCDNAIKYNTEDGLVEVSVSGDEDTAILRVKDTGIGIPTEHQNRVFERFYRVDKSHSKETGGTGLGLSIVKHATLLHNGKIDLRSKAGQGTVITVTLPRH
ncbi:MAG: two-component sensor histidine kinase [Spirochaetales bacterium]|nr:two-component sensor histidine kinase [Spirochaetales bacterium]